jgi:hypothetical protein
MRITPPTSGVFLALPLLLWLSPSVFGSAVPRFAFVASEGQHCFDLPAG